MSILTLIFVLLMPTLSLSAQDSADSLIFEKYIQQFQPHTSLTDNELLVQTALFFQGKPYVASTLEKSGEERLVVNLREFDCTTLVETCLALVRTLKSESPIFQTFREQLQNIRYRGGRINGYASRLHYLSDWAFDNERKTQLADLTQKSGGTFRHKLLNFMSLHTESYPALKQNHSETEQIKAVESEINKRGGFFILPKKNIPTSPTSEFRNGNLVAFATNLPGLDFSHVGILYTAPDGRLTFIHASSRWGKVVVQSSTLADYCKQSSRCDGIAVYGLRINSKQQNNE